jgi:Family of unknown function (DUF6504)
VRRYDDLVEVRLAPEATDLPMEHDRAPGQFVWRGRLYVVGAVLAHWVEVGAWWRVRDAEGLPVAAHATGRQVWRVEARAGRASATGVYDLTRDSVDGQLGDRDLDLDPDPDPDGASLGARSRPTWRLARALD